MKSKWSEKLNVEELCKRLNIRESDLESDQMREFLFDIQQ